MLHIGLDEAGYGPLLGPLVIGAAVLRTTGEEEEGTERLRARLKGLVVRHPRHARENAAKRLPVPVDDSKAVHRRFGLEGLARGFGLFTSGMDAAPPADLEDLLARFSDRQAIEFQTVPWYRELGRAAVPRYPWTGPLGEHFERRGIQALDLRVLPLSAGDFNREVACHDNKARVLGLATATALLSVLEQFPGEDASVVFDRQGARTDYAGYLADLFPFAHIVERPAGRGDARYVIALVGRTLSVLFATGADRRAIAVSWASMAAKLTRELFMTRLNAFFSERLPGLRPTAGYVTDGRRWLREVAPVLDREAIDTATLVRSR